MDTFEAIHPLFQAALDAQDAKFVYQGMIHHLGPRPLLSPVGQARVALRCAEAVVPLIADRRERADALKRLGGLDEGLGRRDYEPPPRPANQYNYQNANQPRPTPEAVVDLAHATVVHACARPRNTWRTARATVGTTARLLKASNAPPRGAELLDRVDDWIMRGELETVAGRRHGALLKRVKSILYRSGEYPARPQIWLVGLDDKQLALFLRQGHKLLLTEGHADDVLATVPDAHFDYCAARGWR